MKGIWRHPWTVAASNILLVMALYTCLRIFCYFVNGVMFPNVTFAHMMEMLLGGLRFDLTAILYLSSLYIVGILLPLPVRWRESKGYQKVLVWIFWIPNALGLFANTADITYMPYNDRRSTCTFFTEVSHDNNLLTIIGQGLVDYWYVVLMFVLVMVVFFRFTRRTYAIRPSRALFLYAREVLLFVASIYMCVIGIRGGFGKYTRPITLSNALQYTNTPRESALVLNTPFTLMKTIESTRYVEPAYFDRESLPQHMTPIHQPDSTRTMRTDNVVVIILESFSKEYIGFYNRDIAGYEGYTPFLDSLLAQSVTFDQTYASGRKSIDAMPSVLSSIPMLIEPYIVTPYSTNAVSSIAERLRHKGYETAFFHGAPNGSMGFQAYARSAGFARYYGMDEYDGPSAFDGTWAIWDEEFLQYYAQTMSTMKEPFMTSVFTASSHHPYKVPKQYKDSFPKGTRAIHAPVGYADHALRRFFETASKEPWFEHTLFVLVADHTNELALPEYTNDRGLFEIPIAFYHPSWHGEMRHGVVSQTDIMPSVLEWLQYNEPYFAFGQDVLTKEKEQPYAVCYNTSLYQIFSDSLMLQFDGDKVVGVYDFLTDRRLKHNLVSTIEPERIAPMTDYLKAFIQQYIHRVMEDELIIDN